MDIKELRSAVPGATRHPWESAKFRIVKFLLAGYKTCAELSRATILDVGCGDAFTLRQLSEQYKDMKLFGVDTAFERDVTETSLSRASNSNIVLSRSLDEIDRRIPGTVDFVLLLDVVEHIENDVEYLEALAARRFISPETYFIITAPAFQCLACSHDRFLGHFRRYSNRSLRRNCESAGMQIIDAGYFFFTLLLPRALQKMYELVRQDSTAGRRGVGHWNYRKFITNIVKNLLYYDFRTMYFLHQISRMNVPGLSNFAICRKKRAS